MLRPVDSQEYLKLHLVVIRFPEPHAACYFLLM